MNLLFTWVACTRADEGQSSIDCLKIVLGNSIFFFAYAYLTAFVLPGAGNYYISLDPAISRKGLGNANFMLKD